MDEDLKYFPDGDMTIVTMGGQVLSGGQQQRIGIARALYSNYDIYVLDDCLSAVDVHVAKHIFQNGILQMLRKKRKTILMAMNQIEFLRFSDKIVILADHQLVEMDSYTNLLKKDHFTQFMKKHYPDFQKAIQEEEKEEDSPRDTAALFMDEATKFQPQEDIRTGGIPWERFWEIVSLGGAKKYMVSIVFNLCRSLLRFLALWVLNSLWVPALQMDDNSYIISFYETAFVCSYVLMISCNVIAIFLQVSHQKTVGSSVFNRVVSRGL
uniref:ABC transporter domain-containing protein n=1 Tax=Arcella intermedia TaxID=1963864 RepID=A0A6B2LAK0_9EUKA